MFLLIKVIYGCRFHSFECFSCENADERNLNSLVICLFLNTCVLFFIHFCFPRHVLTRNQRRAADCCADRSTATLSDSWVKISIKWLGSTSSYPHHWALCFIICACLTTRDLCTTSKTLKSSVWVCFVNILLYWVLNSNPCFDDPIHCTAT